MLDTSTWQFICAHLPELMVKTREQLYLVFASMAFAIVIGLPIGIIATRMPRIKSTVLMISALLWTIPSLALLAFLIPFMGIGVKPAIVALTVYALLPIIRGTITGLDSVPDNSIEAARGLGFKKLQQLTIIELPLAMPIIINGIRTATVICVGIATLAAFIGAGGLGDFINRGLAVNSSDLILLGAIPAAILALIFDFLIAQLERRLLYWQTDSRIGWPQKILVIASILIVFVPFINLADTFSQPVKSGRVVIASKNFTEQFILGELMAQMIEAKTNLQVVRKFNLGSTAICQAAMEKGDVDIYPEYTGTAYLTVLHKNYKKMTEQQLYRQVKQAYQKQYAITWLESFGFENSQSLAVSQQLSDQHQLQTISQLVSIAPRLIVGAPAEFIVRPDAMPGLQKAYGLRFKSIKAMDPGLMYKALENNEVNVIMAFTTDGRIPAYHLVVLKDDKHFFPPYYAAPLIRDAVLKKYPQIAKALAPLLGTLDNKTLQELNYQVDLKQRSVASVAKAFLKSRKLIK